MKVNLQKIIALIIAVTVIITALNISAYATSEPSAMTSQEYRSAQSNLIDKYCNGEITFLEWQERQTAVNTEYLEYNQSLGDTAYAFAITTSNQFAGISEKFANAVQKWGDGARERVAEWWNSVCNSNNVPTESTQTSTIDMQGYGALEVHYYSGFKCTYYTYCSYIVLSEPDRMKTFGSTKVVIVYDNGKVEEHFYGGTSGYYFEDSKFYGDIRYEDGTPAPTDDEYITGSVKKFDEMPDKDLEDLLEDFAEEMERQNPDLSTIEGLLKAIYARMGTLDSDNDNQLLSEVLAAIKAIKSADTDNTELLELLEDIKNSLVFDNGENKETFSEQLKKIIDNQIIRDDFVIDEDLYNNHGDILKERLLGKFSFIYNMKTFVSYCFNQYKDTENEVSFEIEYHPKNESVIDGVITGGGKYKVDFSFFEDSMSFVRWIIAASVYITYAYHTYRKIPSYINGGDNE